MSLREGGFLGGGRFEVKERLGAGGMGTVFTAYDTEREEEVALKLLHTRDASALYRFKKEFRTLADVAHRNLVSLYELVVQENQWFFTMEIIRGSGFFPYVRPGAMEERMGALDESLGGELDFNRLRHALRQLALGVKALHDAGKLHCDLKPSNVMVTSEGRLVILDFGLATELAIENRTHNSGVMGTVAYMAPEQARSEPVSAASDWYAVGVILFEALTGRLPFHGSLFEVLIGKQEQKAPSPSEFADGVPEDLVQLTEALLEVKEADRPNGAQILERLGGAGEGGLKEDVLSGPVQLPQDLVGRERQLETLEEAFALRAEGQAVAVYVHGPSGMGKTAIMHRFLSNVGQVPDALVLRGRCYERERVPYKALDGVVDSLSRFLTTLDDKQVRELMGEGLGALMRIFPVLLQVNVLGQEARKRRLDEKEPDLLVLRRRAFEQLRGLLRRLAESRPLVLYIDDLQWADADSTALLEDLLRPPEAPPLLLLTSFRSEEIHRKAFLRELLEETDGANRRGLEVGPLDAEESQALAASLLDGDPVASKLVLELIVREGEGSPFLIEQLARFVQVRRDIESTGLSLGEMLEERIQRLPRGAREMLNVLVVANRSLDASVAFRAAGLEGDERRLVAALKTTTFVRSSGSAQRIEIYHDRITDALHNVLPREDEKLIHRSLAETLEASGFEDPEALFEHWLGAGDRSTAARWAARAAAKAFAALAFDPAASFYRQALDLAPIEAADRRPLERGLARSLANAGRSREAAEAFFNLADHCDDPTDALEARSRAAEQFLLGGFVEEGVAAVGGVLREVGLRIAPGPRRALLSLLLNRLRLRFRGLSFEERSEQEIPKADLLRIDVCWAVGTGLSMVDNIQGADFQTRQLLLALDAGEPYRVSRALSLEAGILASTGDFERARELQVRALELSQAVESPHALGLASLHSALIDYFSGNSWSRAASAFDEADRIFTERCSGVVWEVTACRRFGLASLLYQGEMATIADRTPRILAEARERGNIHLVHHVHSRMNAVWLAADEPDTARRYLRESMESEGDGGRYSVHRYNVFMAEVQADLYCGEVEEAWRSMELQWPELEGSMLTRVQLVRLESWQTRARAALALAAQGGEGRKELLAEVRRMAKRIAGARRHWANPWGDLLLAGVAGVEGAEDRAREHLGVAVEGFEAAEMGLYAAAARRVLGRLKGGSEGQELVAAAERWMEAQRIGDPERMTAALAPGWT